MSTAKMVFHGSDIEKICEVYHLNPKDIVKFGANVNPLGLSENVKEQLAGRLDILSSYPDRDYTALRNTISEYCSIFSFIYISFCMFYLHSTYKTNHLLLWFQINIFFRKFYFYFY